MNKNIVALLPIKENSTRIIDKNFKKFNSKPLFYWIIKKLDEANLISNIIINTDSEKIIKKQKISKKLLYITDQKD